MFKLIKRLITLIFILIAIGVFGIIYFFGQVNKTGPGDDTALVFNIESGQGVDQIASNLIDQGYITDKTIFKIYSRYSGNDSHFVAGAYDLKRDLSIVKIVKILTSEPTVEREREITILEGWTLDDIGTYLEEEEVAPKAEFISYTSDVRNLPFELPFEIPAGKSMEGLLYPDTYRIFLDATVEDITVKMVNNFLKKLLADDILTTIQDQKLNFYDTLILASIIEKEVREADERKHVADIFLKRIKIGMRLQADSTLNYITKSGSAQTSYDDLQIDSPYNSYMYEGLPPTPISNPDITALRAAVWPTSNDYYYFLTSPDGTVYYSRTLDEHNANRIHL